MMKLPPVPFVFVEWDDAWKDAVGDTTLETAGDDHKPTECLVHGYVVRDDENGIMLANEYSPNGTYRHRSFIPRAMIKNVIPVRLTFPKKRKEKVHESTE